MSRPLRCRNGLFKNFSIQADGTIYWKLVPEHEFPKRLAGKKKKYWQIQLMRNGDVKWYYVHRLMGYSWLGSPPHRLRYIVDHINGDSLDNTVENLRWVTPTGNQLNKKCYGLVECSGFFVPKVAGFLHLRYATEDEQLCHEMRDKLVQSYVRYSCRFPEKDSCDYPHYSIHKY